MTRRWLWMGTLGGLLISPVIIGMATLFRYLWPGFPLLGILDFFCQNCGGAPFSPDRTGGGLGSSGQGDPRAWHPPVGLCAGARGLVYGGRTGGWRGPGADEIASGRTQTELTVTSQGAVIHDDLEPCFEYPRGRSGIDHTVLHPEDPGLGEDSTNFVGTRVKGLHG